MPPHIVNQQDWIEARKVLLEKEKKLMRADDDLSAARRQLPMVRIDKPYSFLPASSSSAIPLSLADLFSGMDQLIVYHFMFAPPPGDDADGRTRLPRLHPTSPSPFPRRAATCVSRRTPASPASPARPSRPPAPLRLEPAHPFPWYSTDRRPGQRVTTANLHVSVRPGADAGRLRGRTPGGACLTFAAGRQGRGRGPSGGARTRASTFGFSVFLEGRRGARVPHVLDVTVGASRGVSATFALLDITPLGRQDTPQGPAAFKPRDEYEKEA